MIQRLAVSDEIVSGRNSFKLILPGNKFPEWIGHQSLGSSITISLPQYWSDSFLGFALCAAFKFDGGKYDIEYVMRVDYQFKSSGESYSTSRFYEEELLAAPKAEHVILFCNPRFPEVEDAINYDEASFEFSLREFHGEALLPSCRIEKHGHIAVPGTGTVGSNRPGTATGTGENRNRDEPEPEPENSGSVPVPANVEPEPAVP
ncbi:hypothetical protein JCGZ_26634 [Jatropha curcas]|uniref:C-JID domain-containing protein n=1 Tax=Jatropha curcas TaxID=180498 RepID=A0A067JJ38_JATCU|nr:hypothetical protein JCGZ_26634 [Jatropha curcas]